MMELLDIKHEMLTLTIRLTDKDLALLCKVLYRDIMRPPLTNRDVDRSDYETQDEERLYQSMINVQKKLPGYFLTPE